jgi:hypothetical protein
MRTATIADVTPEVRLPSAGSTVRSEWTKLRTLRSTWIAAVSAVVVAATFAAVSAATRLHDVETLEPVARAPIDATRIALAGLVVVVLIFGALGVHHASVEFGTGMIRQTLIATPRRRAVVVAKAVAVAAVASLVTLAADLAAWLVGQRVLATKGLDVPLLDLGSVGLLVSAALAAGALAALGAGLGALIRRTAAGTVTFVGLLFGGALVTGAVPPALRPLLPDAALQAATTRTGPEGLSSAAGLALLALDALAVTFLAVIAVERRDV